MDQTAEQTPAPCDTTAPSALPSAPNPSADPGVVPKIGAEDGANGSPPVDIAPGFDVHQLDANTAMKLLSSGMQALADITGEVPPTPPISRPGTPSAASIREHLGHRRAVSKPANAPSHVPSDDVKKTIARSALGSPEAHVMEPDGIAERLEDVSHKEQHDAIARKFFSKKAPPISVDDYLQRMHRYCPMSTAVYLAAGAYLYRLAIEDKSVPVTAKTIHRLLLAALRIAMKALEDLSYPHKRFAGVGGVSERELAKLEISICYLMNFDLRMTAERLQEKAVAMQQFVVASSRLSAPTMQLVLPTRNRSNRRSTVT